MADSIPHITVSLSDLNQQEHQFHRYSILSHKNVFSILAGRHASKLRGRGLDFEEVRKYVAGDDVRNIDWKVTARTKTTYTKVFNEEKERPNYTIVDQSSSMFFGSSLCTKSYISAMLCAISGFKVLKAGDRFGGVIFNDQEMDQIAPKRSRKNLQHFFNHLVRYNQQLATQPKKITEGNRLNEVLHKVTSTMSHDHVIFIVSDFLKADAQTYRYLLSLSKHNDVICAMVNDEMEFNIPEKKALFSDGEKQLLWQGRQTVTKNYDELMQDRISSFESQLLKYGIPVLKFTTEEEISDQLKRVIQKILKR